MKKIMTAVSVAAFVAMSAGAQLIFTDDFQSDAVDNPAPNTLTAGWIFNNTVAGNANSVTDKNEHRISDAPAKGSKIGSKGWISAVPNAFIYVDLGRATASTNYLATVFIDVETSDAKKVINYQVDLLIGADYASAVSVASVSGTEKGGEDGKHPDEFKKVKYTTGPVAATDHIFLQVKRTGEKERPFIFVDDVTVEIVP